METGTLRKSGGIALALGGILLACYAILFNASLPTRMMETDFTALVLSPWWIPVCATALVAVLLLSFGFIATYSVLAKTSGLPGFAGFVTLMTAYLFQFGELVMETFYYPGIVSTQDGIALFRSDAMIDHPAAKAFVAIFASMIVIGTLTFSIALIRSKAFPKVGGVLLVIGAALYAGAPLLALNLAGIAIFALACVIVGRATAKAAWTD